MGKLRPFAEQQRIVATVEGLLALCDALAAGVVQAEAVRGRVVGAALNCFRSPAPVPGAVSKKAASKRLKADG